LTEASSTFMKFKANILSIHLTTTALNDKPYTLHKMKRLIETLISLSLNTTKTII
jgi:hypothetical protein